MCVEESKTILTEIYKDLLCHNPPVWAYFVLNEINTLLKHAATLLLYETTLWHAPHMENAIYTPKHYTHDFSTCYYWFCFRLFSDVVCLIANDFLYDSGSTWNNQISDTVTIQLKKSPSSLLYRIKTEVCCPGVFVYAAVWHKYFGTYLKHSFRKFSFPDIIPGNKREIWGNCIGRVAMVDIRFTLIISKKNFYPNKSP